MAALSLACLAKQTVLRNGPRNYVCEGPWKQRMTQALSDGSVLRHATYRAASWVRTPKRLGAKAAAAPKKRDNSSSIVFIVYCPWIVVPLVLRRLGSVSLTAVGAMGDGDGPEGGRAGPIVLRQSINVIPRGIVATVQSVYYRIRQRVSFGTQSGSVTDVLFLCHTAATQDIHPSDPVAPSIATTVGVRVETTLRSGSTHDLSGPSRAVAVAPRFPSLHFLLHHALLRRRRFRFRCFGNWRRCLHTAKYR